MLSDLKSFRFLSFHLKSFLVVSNTKRDTLRENIWRNILEEKVFSFVPNTVVLRVLVRLLSTTCRYSLDINERIKETTS